MARWNRNASIVGMASQASRKKSARRRLFAEVSGLRQMGLKERHVKSKEIIELVKELGGLHGETLPVLWKQTGY